MNKIPVQQTIVFAYTFLFAHIGMVLAIAGIPALLFSAADYATHVFTMAHRTEIAVQDPQISLLYFGVSVATSLAKLLACAVAAVGVVKEIFGGRSGVVHPFDRTLWRMFAADIRFWLGIIVLLGVVTASGFTLAGVPLNAPDQPPTALSVAVGVITCGLIVYILIVALRMGFLLPAVVVAEAKGGLLRSYTLVRGNVWRLLVIAVALGLPIFIMLVAAEIAVVGTAQGPNIFEPGNLIAVTLVAEDAINQRLLPWEIYNAVVFVLYSGLFYAGAAYAYRAVMPKPSLTAQKIG